jgi:uncharacterized RDD family membrane protein YckC
MSDYAPVYASPDGVRDPMEGAMPSPLDPVFPPEKVRLDAPPPGSPRHEFEVEDRRPTDWPRRRAIVIDNLILFGGFMLISQAVRGYLGAGVFTTALALTYFFVMEATSGQTIGKRMMRLRVVMRDGRPAQPNAVAARTVFRLIDVLPFGWIIGGLAMLLSGGRRQRVGDLVAHTVVRRDDRQMPRPPHSPLVGVYPILWIGVALAVMWQVNLFAPHVAVAGHRTSNPYMQRVDKICERRVNAEAALGNRETQTDAVALWARQMGAIDSLPPAPPSARHDMQIAKQSVREILQQYGREISRVTETFNRRDAAAANRRMGRRYRALQKRFTKLGLPYCATGLHGVG